MAARVRFPSGLWLQYNDATDWVRGSGFTDLTRSDKKHAIARVPDSCLIEWVLPCNVGWSNDFTRDKQVRELVNERLADRRRRRARAKARLAKASAKRKAKRGGT